MKKLLIALCITTVIAIAAHAEAPKKERGAKKRPQLTEEQKKVRKEITTKYDTNKNGRLDKEEKSKMSTEDKEKLEKAGLGKKRKDGDKE